MVLCVKSGRFIKDCLPDMRLHQDSKSVTEGKVFSIAWSVDAQTICPPPELRDCAI